MALVRRHWTFSIFLISILKLGFHISEENSKTGQTNTHNALHSMPESHATKHLRISLALKEALDTILFICGLKLY